ncbi:MAG: PIN domain nuclease, partial [Deltaproteobacteria bacterium]
MAGIFFAILALSVEKLIKHIPLKLLFGGTIGLVLGLSVAKLVGFSFTGLENPTIRVAIYIILSCIFGYIGMVLGSIKVEDVRLPN